MNNDLISREGLNKTIDGITWYHINPHGELVEGAFDDDDALYKAKDIYNAIDNAPTVDAVVNTIEVRPQGEREFIGILAQYVPDDLCTYPEYRGKPYYSIHYKENGEEFVGFGTYNPEVLSRYLKEYFMKGGAV